MAVVFGPTCWQQLLRDPLAFTELGDAYEGGYLICYSGGTLWIVAPASTEVSRDWYSRDNAVTTANANAACGDWFVPTSGQLQNPGYTCITYWDSYSSRCYWSITEKDGSAACVVNFSSGSLGSQFKHNAHCVRAFRCVTY